MIVRAHKKIGVGLVQQLPYVIDTETGEQFDYSITNQAPISSAKVERMGAFIQNEKMNTNLSVQQMVANKRRAVSGPVLGVETPYGQLKTARAEETGTGAARRVLTLTIINGELTTESVVIGDGLGFIKDLMGVGVPKGGVTFDGTYGAASYTALQEISKMMPLRSMGVQFQGYTSALIKSDAFFNGGSFRSAVVDPLKYTITNPYLSFADLVQQDSYNTNIRADDNYRFLLAPISGWVVTLPTATAVTINMTISAFGGAYNMTNFD
jgi:hypothetical protein